MKFLKAHFSCKTCTHSTDIYFDDNASLEELAEKESCTHCGEVKYCNAGDLGYRSDWPDADYAPWQIQTIKLPEDKYVCDTCLKLVSEPPAFKDIVAVCPKCIIGLMYLTHSELSNNSTLEKLINDLSK